MNWFPLLFSSKVAWPLRSSCRLILANITLWGLTNSKGLTLKTTLATLKLKTTHNAFCPRDSHLFFKWNFDQKKKVSWIKANIILHLKIYIILWHKVMCLISSTQNQPKIDEEKMLQLFSEFEPLPASAHFSQMETTESATALRCMKGATILQTKV